MSTSDCDGCAKGEGVEVCEWCCEAPPETETIRCGCWHNPETGYFEACSVHEPEYWDQMMELEAAQNAGKVPK